MEELATLSLNQPVRLFVDNNTDVAHNLRQEFVRIRNNREEDRLAIVTGTIKKTGKPELKRTCNENYRLTVRRLSTNSRPANGQQSADSWPIDDRK